MIGELHLWDLLNCSPKFLHDLPSLAHSYRFKSIFSTNILSVSISYLLITLTGNDDTKMNKILSVFSSCSQWFQRGRSIN